MNRTDCIVCVCVCVYSNFEHERWKADREREREELKLERHEKRQPKGSNSQQNSTGEKKRESILSEPSIAAIRY